MFEKEEAIMTLDRDFIQVKATNRQYRLFLDLKSLVSIISGEITDEQCKHCLAATNLGYQYVFISDQSVKSIELTERVYISESERKYYKSIRMSDARLGEDKVKLA